MAFWRRKICVDELIDLLRENLPDTDVVILANGQLFTVAAVWSKGDTTYIETESE